MKQLDEQKEWEFIRSETIDLHQSNIPFLWRELLFGAQILLTQYEAAEDFTKSFLSTLYLKTKAKYLEETDPLNL